MMITRRKIRVTAPGGVKLGTNHYLEGDEVTLPIDDANTCVSNGWAADVATGETGAPKKTAEVTPRSVTQPAR